MLTKKIFESFLEESNQEEEEEEIEQYNAKQNLNAKNGLKFESFLKICSVFSRGELEEQLYFLFKVMSDPNEEAVTKSSALNFAKLIKSSFQPKKNSRSGGK